jgi:SAM-dependent methyltransferase
MGDEPAAMKLSGYARRLTGYMRDMLDQLTGRSKPAAAAAPHRPAFETPERVAIVQVSHAAAKDDRATRAILKGSTNQIHLSPWAAADLEGASGSAADPKFSFGPLGERTDLLLVRHDAQGILPNAFTAAWLGTLLAEEEVGAVLVGRVGSGPNGGRAVASAVSKWLPERAVCVAGPRWIRLTSTPDLALHVENLPSAYPLLHRAYKGFRDICRRRGSARDVPQSFMYSMLGATRNSLVLERLAARFGWGPNPVIVDIGGGYGFLGLELAAKGWNVAVVDFDPAKTELVGPWLAQRSPRPLPIGFFTRSMDEVSDLGVPGGSQPQAITFFQSLRLGNRDRAADTLRACWARLSPGGALLIHELVHETPGVVFAEGSLFYRDELLRLVAEVATAPSYVSKWDGEPMRKFIADTSMILARKPPSD